MEVKQAIVGVDGFEKELHPETLWADMLDFALVLLVDWLHDEFHKHRRLASQLFQIDLLSVVGSIDSLTVVDEVGHFDIQEQRFLGKLDVEAIVAPIFGDDAQVGLLLEWLERWLYAEHVLGAVGQTCHKVFVA